MSSIELTIRGLSKIIVSCSIQASIPTVGKFRLDSKTVTKTRDFKVDTGATHTCINAEELGIFICEEEFKKWRKTLSVVAEGIDSSTSITFYKFQVDNFILGGIDLGSIPIYITFNRNMKKALIGMDIIRLLNIYILGDGNRVIIEKATKLTEYRKTHLRVEYPELLNLQHKDDLDIQIIDDSGNELTDDELLEEI